MTVAESLERLEGTVLADHKRSTPPTTEEQIKRAAVGQLKPHDAPITLVEYDAVWPANLAREARRIKSVLGDRAPLDVGL